jgi:hypothetical protein
MVGINRRSGPELLMGHAECRVGVVRDMVIVATHNQCYVAGEEAYGI